MQTKEKVGWIISDCHETVGGRVNAMGGTTALDQQWKSFNSYEKKDNRFKQREMLKDEINSIAARIIKAREASNNMVFSVDTGKMQ